MTYSIYTITHKVTGRTYVGITSGARPHAGAAAGPMPDGEAL